MKVKQSDIHRQRTVPLYHCTLVMSNERGAGGSVFLGQNAETEQLTSSPAEHPSINVRETSSSETQAQF
jgi:hypothetical protein